MKYFCKKKSEYGYVSVWPKDLYCYDYIDFYLAGLSFRDNIAQYKGEHVGTLELEPTNTYDENAIRVLAEDGYHVGYVPKELTATIRDRKPLPCNCYFYIWSQKIDGATKYLSLCYIPMYE